MNVYSISNEKTEIIQLENVNLGSQSFYFVIGKAAEFNALCSTFCLMECQKEEYLETKHHSDIEVHKEYYHIILHIPGMNDNRIISRQVDVFYGKNFIVFLLGEEIEVIQKMEQEILSKSEILFKATENPPTKILYMLFDNIVLKSLGIVKDLERKIEAQEEKVLKMGNKGMVNELIILRRQVFRLKRIVGPLVYIDDMLVLNEVNIIDQRMLKYFNSVEIKFSQLNQDVSNLYQSLTNLREAYEAETSNQLNEIMKLFTIISTIFLPLNLITGIYGMNFVHIPGLSYSYGFFLLLAFMAILSGILLMLFKKNKWL
jgi:magnesium transporter